MTSALTDVTAGGRTPTLNSAGGDTTVSLDGQPARRMHRGAQLDPDRLPHAPSSATGARGIGQAGSVSSADDQDALKAEMRSHIEHLSRVFREHYAPADWKAKTRNWDVERERERALQAIDETTPITPKDFHKIIVRFAQAAGDYHVGARFYSTESARLPFSAMAVGDRYFVVDVDRTYHPDFPLEPGDEIVSFGGKPIAEEIKALREELGDNVARTDRALAALRLTARAGRVGQDVPSGTVEVGVKKSDGGPVQTHALTWEYEPERLNKHAPSLQFTLPDEPRTSFSPAESDWARFGTMQTHHVMHPGQTEGSLSRFAIGARESFIPKLGEVVWQTKPNNPFHAYIFKMPDGKKVGYIRIPHYNAAQTEVLQFLAIMARMQFRTDGLIIDQINNPGGSVGYLYSLAAMLSDELLYTPRHRMSITQAEVQNAYGILDINDAEFEAQGIPVELRDTLRDNARFIVEQWRQGKTRTDPYHLGLGDYIAPSPLIQYSKPLMVITNELGFSGGDFFPAILQDNGRAKIFGTRTAGAGGYVGLIDQRPNDLGLAGVSYTGSLAERIDDDFIESDGVTPDVEYELTVSDVRNGFEGYKNAIVNEFAKTLAEAEEKKDPGLLGRIFGRKES